jgi:hypothetical protein
MWGSFAMIVLSDQYMEQHNNFKQLDRTAQGSTTSSKDNNNTSNNEHRRGPQGRERKKKGFYQILTQGSKTDRVCIDFSVAMVIGRYLASSINAQATEVEHEGSTGLFSAVCASIVG